MNWSRKRASKSSFLANHADGPADCQKSMTASARWSGTDFIYLAGQGLGADAARHAHVGFRKVDQPNPHFAFGKASGFEAYATERRDQRIFLLLSAAFDELYLEHHSLCAELAGIQVMAISQLVQHHTDTGQRRPDAFNDGVAGALHQLLFLFSGVAGAGGDGDIGHKASRQMIIKALIIAA